MRITSAYGLITTTQGRMNLSIGGMNRVDLRLCFPWAQAYSCFISFLDHQSAAWWYLTTLYYYIENYTLSSFMNHLELKRVRWRTARNVQYCGTCSGLINPDKKPWTVLKHPKWALYQCKQFVYSVVFGLNLFVCTLDEVNHIFRCKKLSSSQNSLISGLNFTPENLWFLWKFSKL